MSVLERREQFVELRCPIGPKALLAKVIKQGDGTRRTEGNLLELACRDCAKQLRKKNPEVKRVLHRFNILGELVESVVQD
jgi:hypothetical protein